MGYDFQFIKRGDCDDFDEALRSLEIEADFSAKKKGTMKAQMAEALTALDAGFELIESMDIEEIELNHASGVQIILCENSAHINVSHGSAVPRVSFDDVRGYAILICMQSGFSLFDPQLGVEISPDSIGSIQKELFGFEVNKLQEPWWRFW